MKIGKVLLIAAAGAAVALWLKEHVEIKFDWEEECGSCCCEEVEAECCEACEPEPEEA